MSKVSISPYKYLKSSTVDVSSPFVKDIMNWFQVNNIKEQKLIQSTENDKDILDIKKHFFSKLTTFSFGKFLIYSKSMESTQGLLHNMWKSHSLSSENVPAPPGIICFTYNQLDGKGRGNNLWNSFDGCLTFSFSSIFKDGQSLPFVQYVVSLAIIRTINILFSKRIKKDEILNIVKIKWPNDIYDKKNMMKIGGILCQSEYFKGKFYVTTGIGLNISNNEPTTCLNQILLEHMDSSDFLRIKRIEFLAEFCNMYEKMEIDFKDLGFQHFENEYINSWLHTNQMVNIQDDEVINKYIQAKIKGLSKSGCLIATDDLKQNYELFPDGNSFDFFTGLLKRKIN